ncbi:MAG: DUF4783 domain-containing protein [Bacteroidales bacterium]|nr:DUF4783 domain-containing protein [Candidatus Cryptobacteroides faecihippi]MCQ2162883.1 DUF4783 domain-containing protein [Bacteroidales bacterium]
MAKVRKWLGICKNDSIMQLFRRILVASMMLIGCQSAFAGGDSYDVFVPISKYIAAGDAESLSAWFADNLEISVMSTTSNSSKNQATQILKFFFEKYKPRTFEINHTASGQNSKYALGNLNAGGETFMVTIFVSMCGQSYKIQQLKIDRIR